MQTIFQFIPSLLNFVSSGASGELFNITYQVVLSNLADIFAAYVRHLQWLICGTVIGEINVLLE